MKPTRDTAYLTLATSIIGAILILINHFALSVTLTIPEILRYMFSYIPMICFIWLMIFIISILKYTKEKPGIINIFIIYLAYSILQNLINIGIVLLGIPAQKIMLYYQLNGLINLVIIICLVVMSFMLRPTGFRASLRVFAISELFILIFYTAVPPLLALSGSFDYTTYFKYIGLVSLIIPAASIYIAVTALNVINKQQWQKPFYEMDKPDWPPYNKPGL